MRKMKNGAEAGSLWQIKIKTALKQVLKQRQHTYKDLAAVWECSEPTVKRLLGSEELSLSRLLVLLDWLDLSLSDLHKLADSASLEAPRWTAKQIDFLARNTKHFAFLIKLYEGQTPQRIAQNYKISAADLEKILIQLEKFDLVRVPRSGAVKPFYPKMPRLEGALGSVHMRQIIDRVAAYFKVRIAQSLAEKERGLKSAPGGISVSVLEVTEATYLEYVEKIGRLYEDLHATSKLEKDRHGEDKLKCFVSLTGTFLDEKTSADLQLVQDIFGEELRA